MRETAEKIVQLPEIPAKRYFAIGEVSDLCAVKPHVLRYWEQEFPQLKPSKRRGNRRYYQQEDVLMVRHIRSLLYEQGFTIGGARQRLRDVPKAAIVAAAPPPVAVVKSKAKPETRRKQQLDAIRGELEAMLKLLDR
jgi:DNA-binding transcriptional MerR regulator